MENQGTFIRFQTLNNFQTRSHTFCDIRWVIRDSSTLGEMEITDIPTLRYTLVNCLRLSRLHIFISQLIDTVGCFNDFVL